MGSLMFHTPAHKNVFAPAGQQLLEQCKDQMSHKQAVAEFTTLKDLVAHIEQQIKKEELTTGQLLKSCLHKAVEETTDLGNKWDHWELAAELFLTELGCSCCPKQKIKNYVSSKP